MCTPALPARSALPALPIFPAGENAARLIFEAAVHPPEGMSEEQQRFLRLSYERALRRAQGWEV